MICLKENTKNHWSSCIDWMIWQITKKTFYINAGNFNSKQKLQTAEGKNDSGSLFRHQGIQRNYVTSSVVINTFQPKESVIDLDYNNITFNEALSFPYSVPNGYNKL
jgi:hypothetical protein